MNFVFFFKQKTAYEMRISDWSSDVLFRSFFRTVPGRAESLLWKRIYFSHEQEVRLMLIARTWPKDQSVPQVRNVRVDPNRLFHSISFDPRLISFRSEEHTSELQSLMRISYAVFCLKKQTKHNKKTKNNKLPIQ